MNHPIPVNRRATALAALAIAAALAPSLRADDYFWDPNGATAGTGGTGAWTTPATWRQTTVTGTLVNWPASPTADTTIAALTGTGTLTVDAPISTNGIDFQGGMYTIDGTNYITLTGANPTLSLTGVPTADHVISAPLTGSNGITISGSASQATRFIVLANTNAATPNNFTGTLTITNTGALRMGGGTSEQIPDNVDMNVSGVIDFITANGASNGKSERIHDLLETGSAANFSIGNGATFIMHNVTLNNATGSGLALNGNTGTNAGNPVAQPAQLIVEGDLNLNNSLLKIVTTSSSGTIPGGVANLMGNLFVTGSANSQVIESAAATATVARHEFNFAGPAVAAPHTHEVNVAGGSTLTFTAANGTQNLFITSTNGAATVNKTGTGEWIISALALQTTFTGTTDVQQGQLTIGASDRLADASNLTVSGGTFNMQAFSDTVAAVKLTAGSINGTGTATLTSTAAFDIQSGTANARLGGANGLNKTSTGTATLAGANTYTGPTAISNGTLIVSGSLAAGSSITISGDGTLKGAGTINGPITLAAGGKISPGTSPGSLNTASQIWQPGATYAWEIDAASQTFAAGKGLLSGYDWLNIAGNLDLSALSPANRLSLDLIGMDAATLTPGGAISNWDNSKPYSWILASAASGLVNFNPNDFTLLNDFGPANPLGNGAFSILQGGGANPGTANDLLLSFSPTPEPSTLLLLTLGTLLLLHRRKPTKIVS